uniref:Mitochondrial benzodiazepine receptor, putative n=1 Tax=Riptortus pedestris TaxID=329032 RepID=R4WCL9_RIPPE|nr:mitochondrial benzodiazepine receptor, putative [Riptortus pedestris]
MVHCSTLQIASAIVIPNAGGIILSRILRYNAYDSKWSNELKRPIWAPPKWAYAPIWTALFSSVGYASYIVWRDGGGFEGAKLPLTLFGAQLAINWAWSPMFFGLESTKLGLVNFTFLIPTAVGCTYEFFKVDQTAGALMVPYLLWLGFAAFLNFNVHILNQKPEEARK